MYEKFESLLLKSNKTIYKVSADTGISATTLYDWRDGKYEPKLDKLKILSKYFGVPTSYFTE